MLARVLSRPRKLRSVLECASPLALWNNRECRTRADGWWTELTEFYGILPSRKFRSQKETLYNSVNSVEHSSLCFRVLLSNHIKQDRVLFNRRPQRSRRSLNTFSLSLRPLRPPVRKSFVLTLISFPESPVQPHHSDLDTSQKSGGGPPHSRMLARV